ncbi:MAG: hypothetical protein KAI24_24610 [Planctomycetes bacterium]|nr:hypothetical protein [Planctomycetota bacterium]
MNDLTATNESLQARLTAQTRLTDARDALMRAALAVPNNLQYFAEGGSFQSTVVDLVRAIADAQLAHHRTGIAYIHGTRDEQERWGAERTAATNRDLAHLIERLQDLLPRE